MIYVALRNLLHRPASTALCLALLGFGVGIISLLLVLQHELEEKLDRDLVGVDLVVGAKGSPLQLVLSALYHVDAPTGNIPLAEAERLMRHREVARAVPLAYGDYFGGYRILGTTGAYLELYGAELASGRVFGAPLEVVLGAAVAEKRELQVEDTFHGQHGAAHTGEVHEEHAYRVVGVLGETGAVIDQLVLTPVESVWAVHGHDEAHEVHKVHEVHKGGRDGDYGPGGPAGPNGHAASAKTHDHGIDHDHGEEHDHDHHGAYEPTPGPDASVTALLLQLKRRHSILTLPRAINEGTTLQAALPAIEINRLTSLLGVGADTVRLVAAGVLALSAFSVLLVLYGRLRDRRRELALLRCLGYRPRELFGLLLLESLLLSMLGYALGFALSRVGLWLVGRRASSDFYLDIGLAPLPGEFLLLALALAIGVAAALLPAAQAARLEVAEALADNR